MLSGVSCASSATVRSSCVVFPAAARWPAGGGAGGRPGEAIPAARAGGGIARRDVTKARPRHPPARATAPTAGAARPYRGRSAVTT
ncbi:hypothetical protein GCM10017688_57820 [Streptomyces ramulosus]